MSDVDAAENEFNTQITRVARRFIIRRRWHLWGLVPDSRHGSAVEDIHVDHAKSGQRLRIWPAPGQRRLYVDSTGHLVEHTASGDFRRVGFNDFTPGRRDKITDAIKVAFKFKMI